MRAIGIAAGLALAASAGAAPGIAATKTDQAAADPNREICKSRPAIGSRLKRIRTCMTAEQWEEVKLQEQLGMMRRQTNGDAGCNFNEGGSPCGIKAGGRDTPF